MQNDNNFVGNYQLLRKVGRGSFGDVYLVCHRFLPNHIAAMKILHASRLSSPRQQETFLQEVQYLGMLKHRHILAILDAGIYEGVPYLVTKYAPHGSLRDLLKRYAGHPLPLDQALSIIARIGSALHYTHLQNIIHHDVKPENILFNARDEVLLADFGTALLQEPIQRQRTAAFIGTPIYLAPECFQGYVSRKSDQYSLGCLAYELLTGQPPFSAPTAAALGVKHAHTLPVPPSHFNTSIPAFVEQAVLRTLEKRRINRFDDVLSFVRAIHPVPQAAAQPLLPLPANKLLLHTTRKTVEQWIHEGIAYRAAGRYHEALITDEQAISLDPFCAEAYNNKGNSLYHLKRYREALIAYERAIMLNPRDAYAQNNKGLVLSIFGRHAEALACFEYAISIDSKEPSFYRNKSRALRSLGRERSAQFALAIAGQLQER
jgi:serine/threonine protein kinase